jgi:hypothetical protein
MLNNLFGGLFLVLIFVIGLILGYRGLSLREVGQLVEHYAEEGDKYVNKKLNEIDKVRKDRKDEFKKQDYQLYEEVK